MSNRSRADSSATSSIDPFHYQALQDTNEALKSELQRLARADDDNTTKIKLQVSRTSILFSFVPIKERRVYLSCFFFFFFILII
jgi:hypothetical protein